MKRLIYEPKISEKWRFEDEARNVYQQKLNVMSLKENDKSTKKTGDQNGII